MREVTIQNDISYLFIQWLGWDYNFWTVIFTDIILTVFFNTLHNFHNIFTY